MTTGPACVVVAKSPAPARVKTRLRPPYTPDQAAELPPPSATPLPLPRARARDAEAPASRFAATLVAIETAA